MGRLFKFLWIASLLAVFFLLLMPYISPRYRGLMNNLIHPFLPQMSLKLYSDSGLAEENKRLQEQLAYYESQDDYKKRLFDENESLRISANMPPRNSYDSILTQVSVRNPLTGKFRFIIEAGEESGLTQGMPVMVKDSLFGRLIEVKKKYAIVGTLAKKDIHVSCRIRGTDFTGKLGGEIADSEDGELLCLLTWLPRDAEIKAGMLVETSGFSSEDEVIGSSSGFMPRLAGKLGFSAEDKGVIGAGLIPGAVKVGVVKSVSRNEIFQEAVVALSADWQGFDYVTVLKKKE